MTPQEALALPDGSLTRDEVRDLIDTVAQQERERLRNKAFPGRNVAQKFASVDRAFFDDPDEADR